ncbi:MAG: hypothetical protein EHM13_11705 [Acidobacteria bacterium]|nr:MAG: hypothetical protein EHM13_11705 [Acidobacteriota bacterium]
MTVVERLGRFLDPIIAVRRDGGYWTPSNHRLQELRKLGVRSFDFDAVLEDGSISSEAPHREGAAGGRRVIDFHHGLGALLIACQGSP